MEAKENRPAIRCSHIKGKFKSLELLDPAVRNRVLERFPKDTFRIIQETNDDEWVPVEYNLTLTNCLIAELGEQGLYDWNLKAFSYSIASSTWGTYLRTALNLFKIKTTSFMQLGPYIWKNVYRNCGDLSVTKKTPNKFEVVIRNLPQVILESRPYLLANGVAFVCLFALGNIQVDVTLEQLKNTRDAIYQISFDPSKQD